MGNETAPALIDPESEQICPVYGNPMKWHWQWLFCCPRCGSPASVDYKTKERVTCRECGETAPTREAWNQRDDNPKGVTR